MSHFQAQLNTGFRVGVKKGWGSFIWICQIIVLVSFLVTLLQWSGWLNQLYSFLSPFTGLINLPPEAALPLISGMLINLYAVIAIITVLPFTVEQMTLIAIFNLIAHSFILEGIIQHRSGINVIKATVVRIAVAILTVFLVSQFFGDTSRSIVASALLTVQVSLLETLEVWAVDLIILLLKIFGIIMTIMIILEVLRALGWAVLGLNLFWLVVPRFIMAVIGVQLYRFIDSIEKRLPHS